MNYKGVIFDLDGTLVNSLTDLANSVNTVLTEYNLPTHDIESYKYRVGNGIKKLMERSLPQDKQYLLDEALAKFKQVYAKHNLDHTAPYEDILTLLKKLQQQNIKLGICGEHGGEPKSIEFCHKEGLSYVSCSPYRVPIARLAAAQAAISNK